MAKRLTTYEQVRLQIVGYRLLQSKISEVLSVYSLNSSQWIILGRLSEHPDGLRITAIAEFLAVEIPLVTVLLQDLESLSLVTLGRDPLDGRAKVVQLTPQASKLVPTIEAELRSHIRPLIKNVPAAELDQYYKVLQTILASRRNNSSKKS
jgi:MarR family transcriptional regulator, transcriptional regulator for hemolysin